MYTPRSFRVPDRDTMLRFIAAYGFATLVSREQDGGAALTATHLPMTISHADAESLLLRAHVARANPHWETLRRSPDVLVIFQGPHAYISPTLYERAESVPTWDYMAVHAHGRVTVETQPEVLGTTLQELITQYEPAFEARWRAMPDTYRSTMAGAIVGLRIDVSRLEASFKLSQNRSEAERRRIVDHLGASRDGMARDLAAQIERTLNAVPGDPA